jgi:hypothetical protein
MRDKFKGRIFMRCCALAITILFAVMPCLSQAGPGIRALGGYGLALSTFHTGMLAESGPMALPYTGLPGEGAAWAGEVFYDFMEKAGEGPEAPATRIKPLRVLPTPASSQRTEPFLELALGTYGLGLNLGKETWNGLPSSFSVSAVPLMASLNLVCPLRMGLRLVSGLGAGYVPATVARIHSQRYAGPDASNPYPYTLVDGSVLYTGGPAVRGSLAAEYDVMGGFSLYLGASLLAANLVPTSGSFTQTTQASASAPASATSVSINYVDRPEGPSEDWKENMAIHFCQSAVMTGVTWRY